MNKSYSQHHINSRVPKRVRPYQCLIKISTKKWSCKLTKLDRLHTIFSNKILRIWREESHSQIVSGRRPKPRVTRTCRWPKPKGNEQGGEEEARGLLEHLGTFPPRHAAGGRGRPPPCRPRARPAALARGLRASRSACAPPRAAAPRWCAAHHCREGERERERERERGRGVLRSQKKLGMRGE